MLTRPVRSLRPPLAASSSGQALSPRYSSHLPELTITRHHQGFTRVHPPGLPLARDPPDGTGALGLLPRASHPSRQDLRRTPGRETGIEHSPGATRPTSPDLLSTSSLAMCDLVSHGPLSHAHMGGRLWKYMPYANVVGRSQRSPATPAMTARRSASIWPVTPRPGCGPGRHRIRSTRSSTMSPPG